MTVSELLASRPGETSIKQTAELLSDLGAKNSAPVEPNLIIIEASAFDTDQIYKDIDANLDTMLNAEASYRAAVNAVELISTGLATSYLSGRNRRLIGNMHSVLYNNWYAISTALDRYMLWKEEQNGQV